MPASVTILGSTGSIGLSALRVIDAHADEWMVHGLACGRNLPLLEEQVKKYSPSIAAAAGLTDDELKRLADRYPQTRFLSGDKGVEELASEPVDICLSAIVGRAGLKPTVAAMGRAKRVALANKESLVMAGPLITRMAKDTGTELLPVDSEHSAIFMLLEGREPESIERIILTASGGSLRDEPVENLHRVDPSTALNHPTWDMGRKITIDSATLMNKGLEVIEAHYLFGMNYDSIDVIIHPQSVVHSLVELVDGALLAHLGPADMVFPITQAFTWPGVYNTPFERLSLEDVGRLEFRAVERKRYPALDLCYRAGREGGTLPAVLNAANEEAVEAFLEGRIAFTSIPKVVEKILEGEKTVREPGLEEIFNSDREARIRSREIISGESR
jgi:1-deoxy-D-xylulose-5-phosphate reductoisomerase